MKLKLLFIACLAAAVLFSGCRPQQNEEEASVTETTSEGIANSVDDNSDKPHSDIEILPGEKYALMSVEGFGEMTIKLYPEYAPVAVENFIRLAEEGYYDGKNFHRIMEDFMIQGGSLNGDGLTDPDALSYGVEINANMRHFYGAVSMAKSGLGECGAQFYIVNGKDTNKLNELGAQIIPDVMVYMPEMEAEIKAALESNDENYIKYAQSNYDYYSNMLDLYENITDDVVERYERWGGVPFLDGGYTVFGLVLDGFEVIDKISDVPVTMSANNEMSVPETPIIIEHVKILTA